MLVAFVVAALLDLLGLANKVRKCLQWILCFVLEDPLDACVKVQFGCTLCVVAVAGVAVV